MARTGIPGWDPIVHIYREWIKTPPRPGAVVVEVGVALGKSLSFLADWCLANGRQDVEVWAVDSWCGNQPNGEQFTMSANAGGHMSLYGRMMLEHDPGAFEFIRPVRASSDRAARMFDAESVDLVVIDADHRYEGCLSDITTWFPKVRPGGWIGGDDHHEKDHPGVVRACRQMFPYGYEVTDNANGQGPDARVWIVRRPSWRDGWTLLRYVRHVRRSQRGARFLRRRTLAQ